MDHKKSPKYFPVFVDPIIDRESRQPRVKLFDSKENIFKNMNKAELGSENGTYTSQDHKRNIQASAL